MWPWSGLLCAGKWLYLLLVEGNLQQCCWRCFNGFNWCSAEIIWRAAPPTPQSSHMHRLCVWRQPISIQSSIGLLNDKKAAFLPQHESGTPGGKWSLHLVSPISQLQSFITSITLISPLSPLLFSLSLSLLSPSHFLIPPCHHTVTGRLVARVNSYVTTAAVLWAVWGGGGGLLGWGVGVGVCLWVVHSSAFLNSRILCVYSTLFVFIGFAEQVCSNTALQLAFLTWIMGNK